MNRHDVHRVSAKRLERGLQLILLDREITVDQGVIIGSGKRGPGVDTNVIADLEFMHLRFVTNAVLHHSILDFTCQTKDFVQGPGLIELFSANDFWVKVSLGFRSAARISL